jgi:Flp pilus assembly protein TadD
MIRYTPLELAHAYIKTGEWQEALSALAQQLEQEANDQSARRLRVEILLRHDASAEGLWSDLSQLDDADSETWRLRALAYERQDNLPQTLDCLQRAHALAPQDAHLTERLLAVLVRAGEPEAALALIAEQAPSWGWQARAGAIQAEQGHYPQALTAYTQALAGLAQGEQSPYRASLAAHLYSARGQVYLRCGRLDEAEADYSQAEQLQAQQVDWGVQFNRGLVALLRGDASTAQALCQSAYQHASPELRAELRRSLGDRAEYAAIQLAG